MMGYGTLGEGTGIMSFMQVGHSGNNLPLGGLDPKSHGLLTNMNASKIDKKNRVQADDNDISVEDQSLVEQIFRR